MRLEKFTDFAYIVWKKVTSNEKLKAEGKDKWNRTKYYGSAVRAILDTVLEKYYNYKCNIETEERDIVKILNITENMAIFYDLKEIYFVEMVAKCGNHCYNVPMSCCKSQKKKTEHNKH